ncbi:glycoside hydrolase family 6 protein [Planomonospora venezuelensis]|uniref:Protein kinase domain-containing protein n=1 Tax=Planomonospora venezuelensis TaxID=1999 RepID=A0A841CSN4_PLAVE|nr:glycoside hydrolase family 6 protein [Planomonospora venezuelensis]MBB5961442.1 hypothetical protein [Planomonospora venezuelensis]GIN03188.1 hypothetical protein Pve01_48460 [Planomonospora venezuelensis]
MDELRDGDPRRIGPYTLLGRLGQGGMGLVYLARDEAGAQVAVKVIHAHLADDPGFRGRFRQEVTAAQRVARFCTAPVLAADVDGALAYLATEFVPGPSLEQAVRTGGPLTGSSLDGLAASIAVALRAIHGAQVVHRDLKPSNVLLSPVGPRVIDFGIARLAEGSGKTSSVLVGTPAFMSPEQVKGDPATPASDVFAWGGVLVYAATGHGPFGTGAVPALLYRVAHGEPDLSGLPDRLLPLVTAALAKDPAARPTPQDLLDALSTGSGVLPVDPGATAGRARGTRGAPGGEEGRGPALRGALTAFGRRPWTGAGALAAVAAAVAAAFVVPQAGSAGEAVPSASSPAGPSSAVSSPAASGAVERGPASGPAAPSSSAPPLGATGPNPLDEEGVRLFAPENEAAGQARLWAAAGRARDAELMEALAAVPQAVWLKGPADKARRTVAATLRAAGKAGSVPVFVGYNVPLRNCRPAGGAADASAYRSWIDQVAEEIGDARAVVILEPESLVKIPGTEECGLGDDAATERRFGDLSYAVERLGELPRTAVYLDGSFEKWPALSEMGRRLVKAKITEADGFFLNASGYQRTEGLAAYGARLARCVYVQVTAGTDDCLDAEIAAAPDDPAALPHFVIDTSRNGRGEWVPETAYPKPQTWCNPPGRGVGFRPTTATSGELVDAYLWISVPGHANGPCTRGTDGPEDPVYRAETPPPGTFWPELALERARLASPPLP